MSERAQRVRLERDGRLRLYQNQSEHRLDGGASGARLGARDGAQLREGARCELLVAGGLDALGRRLRGQRRHSALLRRAVAVAGARARGLLLLRIQLPPAGQCSVPACCARKPP